MEDVFTAPVTEWETGTIREHGMVIIRLRYLTHAMQTPEQAHRSPTFVLTAGQAQELANALAEKSQLAQGGPLPGSQSPKH